jgi:signal peptidase I
MPVGHDHALKCELACEVLREFGSLRFAATGWSMLPSIWPGDTLMVERVQPQQIHIGDVVLLGRDARLCAHRVVSTPDGSGNPRWITRGDAMSAPDRPVIESELLGRVAYVIRAGKCIPVRAEVSVAGQLTARLVRRSVPAARALVYLHGRIQGRRVEAQKKSVSSCPS